MKKIVVLTGAGMSVESGLSTFRDAGGLWENHKVEQVATPEGFAENPQLVLDFYNHLRKQLLEKKPNKGHSIIAEWEKKFEVCVITQNVDDLHERAGSTHVIHLHGELMKATSSRDPNNPACIQRLNKNKIDIHLHEKAADSSQLRPYIVWFGEPVPKMDEAINETADADLFIIIGSSLNVYPAAGLLHYVPSSASVFLIDPNEVTTHSLRNITVIQKGASEGLEILTRTYLGSDDSEREKESKEK